MFLQAGHTMPVNVGTTVREFRCRKGDQLVGEEGEEGHGCEAAEAGHRNSLERHVQIADSLSPCVAWKSLSWGFLLWAA